MKPKIRIVKKEEDNFNVLYWSSLTGVERLKELEEIREQYNQWRYGADQGFQRVYRIVKNEK